MDTSTNHYRGAICSVTEMARKLGLSRARLYQLVETEVFPPPVRSGTRRPFYPPDLQQICLQIRKTGVGFNGLHVLFNKRRQSGRPRSVEGGKYDGLVAALKNMGLKVNANAVKHAVQALYPAEQEQGQDPNGVLRDLFRHFHPDCQNDV
jgi:DNA-binding transcriptional MerR regulator